MVSGFRWSVIESCLKFTGKAVGDQSILRAVVVTVILAAFRDKC